MDYTKVEFTISPFKPWSEILTSQLAEIGFESFTEEDQRLQAYIPSENYNTDKINSLSEKLISDNVKLSFTETEILAQNWNAVWESDFQPVIVDQDLIIYAPFHDIDLTSYKYNVQIQPQMSFGTGHHQTTYLLSKTILNLDVLGKNILDVGTGTGILGILCSKLGASSIFGTDIEPGACENAIENIDRNLVKNFSVEMGDIDIIPQEEYDIIIANINKNVLKSHFDGYANRAKKGSLLMLSGFFESDVAELEIEAKKSNFMLDQVLTFETWAVMILKKH